MDYTDNLERKINLSDTHGEIIAADNSSIFQDPNGKNAIHASIEEKNSSCPFCDFETSDFDSLKSHIDTVHTVVKYKACPYCRLKKLSLVDLKQHIKSYHWDLLIHRCNECDYRAAKETNLKAHKRNIHAIDKHHQCSTCGYKTALPSRLKFHLETIHKLKKPYHCPMCNYRTAVRSTLKTHIMAKHEKKKPHECPKCKYTCTQIGTMHKHIASHFKSSPYYRNKNSNIKSSTETMIEILAKEGAPVNFTTHVNISSIDTLRPNTRNSQRYDDQSSNMKKLLSDFIEENIPHFPYKCHICCYSTDNNSSLNIHLMTQHTKQVLVTSSIPNAQTLSQPHVQYVFSVPRAAQVLERKNFVEHASINDSQNS